MMSRYQFPGFEPLSQEELSLTIPRSFFERVILWEPASTIRVVAFILTRSLEGQHEVEASYSDLIRELRLSRKAIQEGLARAIEAGYIRQLQNGGRNHVRSRYALCWASPQQSGIPTSSGNPTRR